MTWQQNKEARRAAYGEKLKDPRWQKMRLQVLERDGWACRVCSDTESTLHVHHTYYETGKEPWEYPLYTLLTLCADCHTSETEGRADYEQMLLRLLRENGYLCSDIFGVTEIIFDLPAPDRDGVMLHAISSQLRHGDLGNRVVADYFARIKALDEKSKTAAAETEKAEPQSKEAIE